MSSSGKAQVCAPEDLGVLVRRLSGYVADLHAVALDDQTAKLHIPLARADAGFAGKLLVARVADLIVERDGQVRWFGLDGLAYDPVTRRLTLVAIKGLRLVAGVEALDLAVRLRALPAPAATTR